MFPSAIGGVFACAGKAARAREPRASVPESGDPAIVRLEGDQDIASRRELHAAFQAVRDNPHVIADLTGLRDIDSTAIEQLYRAADRAASLRGQLVIVARNQRLVRLLSIAGLTKDIPIVDTLPLAVARVREPRDAQ
jgi:anti-anti-sigma factor